MLRAAVERIEAADGEDFAASLLPLHERNPFAADDPPAFVDDRVGRRRKLERAMHGQHELLKLLPQLLPVAELFQMLRLQKIAGEFRHLHEEAKIAPLRRRPATWPLKDLDNRLCFTF